MKNILPKIEYLLNLVKRFWLIILIASVIGGALGGIITRIFYQPEYEMTQAFTIELKYNPTANQAAIGNDQLSKTIPSLLSSDVFSEHMAQKIKEAGASGKFKVTSLETSNIFYITCIARSNNDAQIIINEIQEHYNEIANKVIGESEMKFLAPPSYSKLPINTPHYTLGVIIGILLGVIIILAMLILRTIITVTVTSAQEMEKDVNAKCLATINHVYNKKRSSQDKKQQSLSLVTSDDTDFDFKKSISTLSSNVEHYAQEKGYKTILVSSTVSGEGKSTISVNLACDLADKGNKVLIVDCDLRTPNIASYLNIDRIDTPLTNSIKHNVDNVSVEKTAIKNLYFSGNIEGDDKAFENATSQSFKKIIKNLKSQFDYVILDSPPVGFLGDGIAIGDTCDCFIYVVSYNSISKPYIIRSMSAFSESRAEMLGFVLNNR